MIINRYLAAFSIAAIFFLVPLSSQAQNARPNFNRAQTYDVQHYILRVSFDQAKKRSLATQPFG